MRFVLGGAAAGNAYKEISLETVIAIIDIAWEMGVRAFDTAALYGYGLSEERIAEALKKYPREEYILSTKVGYILEELKENEALNPDVFINPLPKKIHFDYTGEGIRHSLKGSLDRLKTNYIDICYVHNLTREVHKHSYKTMLNDFLTDGIQALYDLKKEDTIGAIGLGINNWETAVDVLNAGAKLDYIMLACHYTLAQQTVLDPISETIPDSFFDLCKQKGVRIITAGTLNSGILSGSPKQTTFNYVPATNEQNQKIEQLTKVCKANNTSLLEAAVHFPLLNSEIVEAVAIGAYSIDEITETLTAFKKEVSNKLWKELKDNHLIHEKSMIPEVPEVNNEIIEIPEYKK